MLYADDACIVSRLPQMLAKMMEVIVEVFRAFALTVSTKKTEIVYVRIRFHNSFICVGVDISIYALLKGGRSEYFPV